jgi:hypothetical protein
MTFYLFLLALGKMFYLVLISGFLGLAVFAGGYVMARLLRWIAR